MNEKTKETLLRLAQMGVSKEVIESLSKEANTKPELDTFIASNGILSNDQYNTFVATKEKEYADKVKAVQELGTLQDASKLNPELLQNAKSRIEELQSFLIKEHGYDENEVKEVSAKLITDIDATVKNLEVTKTLATNTNLNPNQNGDRKEMTKEELEAMGLVDTKMLSTSMANIAFGNLSHAAKVNNALLKAQRLGIEVKDEDVDKFVEKLGKELSATKGVDAIADEHFGFSVKQQELNKTNTEAEIARQVNEQVATKLKEAGLNIPRQVQIKTPGNIFDKKRIIAQTANADTNADLGFGKTVVDGKEVPLNKYGHPMTFRTRLGSTEARIQANGDKYVTALNEAIEQNHGMLD